MNSVRVGNEFEDKVFKVFSKMIEEGKFFLQNKNIRIEQKKGYYSEARKANIFFDITIEVFLPEQIEPSFIVFIECKNYSKTVPIDDLEEFHTKVLQIAPNANKAILVTNSSFSDTGINYAKTNKIALVRLFDDSSIKWVINRDYRAPITEKEINLADNEIINAFCNNEYIIYNNPFIFFDDKPIHNSMEFIESIFNNGKYQKHFVSSNVMESIYKESKKAKKNVIYLSNTKLVNIADEIRKKINHNSINLYMDIASIIEYIKECENYTISYVKEFHFTIPQHYLAMVDYENKEIAILEEVKNTEPRLRFTLIHELSHLILHKPILENISSNKEVYFLSVEIKKQIETQANKLTSYILVSPYDLEFELKKIVIDYNLNYNRGYYLYLDNQKCNIAQWIPIANRLTSIFGISEEMLKIRLIEIGFLKIGQKEVKTPQDIFY